MEMIIRLFAIISLSSICSYAQIVGPSSSASDGSKVSKSGDTMTGPLTLSGSSLTVTGNAFSVGGSTLVVSGGKVGVGVAPTTVNFDVLGSARVQGSGGSFAEFTLKDNTASGSTWNLYSGYPALGDFNIRESGVADRIVIKKTSGNVGIGTAVPAKPLHVKGEIWAGVSGTANDNVVYIQPGANGGKIEAYDFGGGGAKQLYLNPNGGNVGIGNVNPGTKLHLSSGTITMDGTGAPTTGGALCLNAAGAMAKCTSAVDASGNCTCP